MIPVTKPFLPPRQEYDVLVDEIWDRVWLTNNGPLVHRLESALAARLGVGRPLYVTNGTVALQLVAKALRLEGEVITTPFSYVATTSSLVWEGCTPVFADIDPCTFTLDPAAVEAAITPRTTGIVATHVFGAACDIDAFDEIGRRHGLAVVYDGAHAFGTTYRGASVFAFGDATTSSFHATKVFHTVEGGAVFTRDPQLGATLERMRNFGHVDHATFDGVGINAKASELHAAMGLCNLAHLDELLARRHEIHEQYMDGVATAVDAGRILTQAVGAHTRPNHAYVPLLFEQAERRARVHEALVARDIHPRRYFWPGLNTLDYVKPVCVPVSDDVASRILCLPCYHDMRAADVEAVVEVVMAELSRP